MVPAHARSAAGALTALVRELMTARGVPIDESLNSGSGGCAKPAAPQKKKG